MLVERRPGPGARRRAFSFSSPRSIPLSTPSCKPARPAVTSHELLLTPCAVAVRSRRVVAMFAAARVGLRATAPVSRRHASTQAGQAAKKTCVCDTLALLRCRRDAR